MHRSLIFLLFLLSLLFYGCDAGKTSAATDSPPVKAIQTPAALLSMFQADVQVCASLMRLLESDRSFIDTFLPVQIRQKQSVESLLSRSAHAKSREVDYFLWNRKYLEIGVDFHGEPWAVAWMEKEPIYCAATFARLDEIEALGESADAWNVRVHFLDKALENLDHPSNEGPGNMVAFEAFERYVRQASKVYTGTQKLPFYAWIDKAINVIDLSRKDIADGAAGLTSQKTTRYDRRKDRVFTSDLKAGKMNRRRGGMNASSGDQRH